MAQKYTSVISIPSYPYGDTLHSAGLNAYLALKAVSLVTPALRAPQADSHLLLLGSQALMAISEL